MAGKVQFTQAALDAVIEVHTVTPVRSLPAAPVSVVSSTVEDAPEPAYEPHGQTPRREPAQITSTSFGGPIQLTARSQARADRAARATASRSRAVGPP